MNGPPASVAPDWRLIPFDVGCARCGQDLRGLVEPKCPACALEFDWSVAVPVEELVCSTCGYHLYGLTQTRCPECGTDFTWEGALAEHHRRRLPLFEYHWRNRPVRSLVATWRLSLSPKMLWRTIDIHDPPRIGALLVMAFFFIVVFSVGAVLFNDVCDWLGAILGDLIGQRLMYFRGWGGPLEWETGFGLLILSIGWLGGVLGLLSTLRWSMAACRIKPAHVLRATVYSFVPAAAIPAVMVVTLFVYDAFMAIPMGVTPALDKGLGVLVALVNYGFALFAVVWPLRSLAHAYRSYIRMPHAWGVAIAAFIAGGLLGVNTMLVIALVTG